MVVIISLLPCFFLLQRIMFKHLRIKKKYLEAILDGSKNKEYRDFKPFYKWLEDPNLLYLILHYQTSRRVIVKIKKVSIIKTPTLLKKSDIKFSNKVYSISLEKASEI